MYKIDGKKIEFNAKFNKKLDDSLIKLIGKYEELEFETIMSNNMDITGSQFNHSIYNFLYGLKILTLGVKFNFPITKLPESLESLYLYSIYYQYNLDSLPNNLLKLYFNYLNIRIDNLPNKLKDLHVSTVFNCNIDALPGKLDYLFLSKNFNKHVGNLPNKLKIIVFGKKFNKSIDNIPDYVSRIIFYDDAIPKIEFNRKINKLPKQITNFQYIHGFSADNDKITLDFVNKQMHHYCHLYNKSLK